MALTEFRVYGAALAAFMMLSLAADAQAEDVRWRADYASAREEAVREHRPLVLVVESASCGWCRKLEQTTFRDASVVRELNDTAVPIRLDADDPSHSELIDALQVDGLPTIVGAAPDGLILVNQARYLDAPQFLRMLRDLRGRMERSK